MPVGNTVHDSKNKIFYYKFDQLRQRFIDAVDIDQDSTHPHTIDVIQRFFYKFLLLNFLQCQHVLSCESSCLQHHYQQVLATNGNYYNDYLKKSFNIFFDTEISSLFEKTSISNDIFADIFGLLENYNWTLDEYSNISDEHTLTPNILKYIFENSLALRNTSVPVKKLTGSYYSPQNISSFITKKSLESFLLFKVNNFHNTKYTSFNSIFLLDRAKIQKIASYVVMNVIFDMALLDNACGSGEFLITIFYELVEIWSKVLYYSIKSRYVEKFLQKILLQYNFSLEYFNWNYSSLNDFKKDKNWQYFIKWVIVTHNIYGVDINADALEITKMRLWLAILANNTYFTSNNHSIYRFCAILDNTIRTGNSLIGYTKLEPKILDLALEADHKNVVRTLLSSIQTCIPLLKKNFSLTTTLTTVNDLLILKAFLIDACFDIHSNTSDKIRAIIAKITTILYTIITPEFYHSLPVPAKNSLIFDKILHWQIDFPKVMSSNGFDIIVGNPPYITLALGKKQHMVQSYELEIFKTLYTHSLQYKGNLYSIFIERSLFLLKENGVLGFIVPNTLLLNSTAEKIRKNILENSNIILLLNIKDKIFEDAEIGGNVVLILSKSRNPPTCEVQIAEISDKKLLQDSTIKFSTIRQQHYLQSEKYRLYTNIITLGLMKKIIHNTKPLGDIVCFYQGIITGNNAKFITDQKLDETYKPLIRGKDIQKYSLVFNKKYILFDKTQLWSNTNEKYFLSKEKIISRQTGDKLIAVYDDQQYYSLDSTHIHVLKDKNFLLKYILALFNSRLLNYYYQEMVQETGRPFAQVKIVNLKRLPIKILSLEEQQPFVQLVDQLLYLYKEYTSLSTLEQNNGQIMITTIKNIESTLDELVYSVYELTEDELKFLKFHN